LQVLRRGTKTLFLACMCILSVVGGILGASPAQAARNEVDLSEYFFVATSSVTYSIYISDYSKTLDQKACEAAPQVTEWSEVHFEAGTYSNDCRITTKFNRFVNPYIEIDDQGNLTFAAKLLKYEELNLGLPSNVKLTRHDAYLQGSYLTISELSPGAVLDEDDNSTDEAKWMSTSETLIGAKGSVQIFSDFHAIERKEVNGVVPADLPSGLEAVVHTRSITPYTPSPSPTPYRPPRGIGTIIKIILVPVVCFFFIIGVPMIMRANSRRKEREQRGFAVPLSYQSGTGFSGSLTPGDTGQNPFKLSDDFHVEDTPVAPSVQDYSPPTQPSSSSAQSELFPEDSQAEQGKNPFAPPSE